MYCHVRQYNSLILCFMGVFMSILRARTAGFCMGVSLALQKLSAALARREAADGGDSVSRLVMLGPIIHNPEVLAEYESKGVVCAHGLDELRSGDMVVIRAHGIPRTDEARMAAMGLTLIDATCPKVKKAQVAIDAATRNGASLLLFGEEDHPEVRGLVSYAGGHCQVFSAPTLPKIPPVPVVLAAQTTQDRAIFESLVLQLHEQCPEATVLSTICDATAKRQKETVDIARKVDMMLVIGGRDSGNTRRLVDVARAEGVVALHVERTSELPSDDILCGYAHIGLTAGASTPRDHVDAAEQYLVSLGKRCVEQE